MYTRLSLTCPLIAQIAQFATHRRSLCVNPVDPSRRDTGIVRPKIRRVIYESFYPLICDYRPGRLPWA